MVIPSLFKRRDPDESSLSVGPLSIALLILISVGMLLAGALMVIHRRRKLVKDIESQGCGAARRCRHLTIRTVPFGGDHSEKLGLISNSSPLTPDSIPEIRITFPEEEDAYGRRKSGRVVIVQVGEAGVGYVRPVPEESLPPYQQLNGFSSVDLEKVGGLKEVDRTQWV